MFETTFKRAVSLVRAIGVLSVMWPLGPDSKYRVLHLIYSWVLVINLNVAFIPLLVTLYQAMANLVTFVFVLSLVIIFIEVDGNMYFSQVMSRREFRVLIDEIEDFVETAEPWEMDTMNRYVNRHFTVQVASQVLLTTTAISFMLAPFTTDDELVLNVWYPESVKSNFTLWCVLYVHHSIAALHFTNGMQIDSIMSTVLYYTAAKVELLGEALKKIENEEDLKRCIKEHQHIIKYTDE